MKIGIIGLGRAGFNMARYFKLQRHDVFGYEPHISDNVLAKSRESDIKLVELNELLASVKWLFIAVPDDLIGSVLSTIKDFKQVNYLGHFSGASDILALDLAPKYIKKFSLHPIRAFSSPIDNLDKFKNIHFGFEGDLHVLDLIKQMLPKSQGHIHLIDSKDKPIYHLSAVLAANLIMNVLDQAEKGYKSIGIDEQSARHIVHALAQTAIDNYRDKGLLDALTGPIARGDIGTLKKHIHALSGEDKKMYIHGVNDLLTRYKNKLTPEKIKAFKAVLETANE